MNDKFEVSLDNCHEEPIHIPGSIQPHGYLLAVVPDDLSIRYVSENICDILPFKLDELVGSQLAALFDSQFTKLIHEHRHSNEFYKLNPLRTHVLLSEGQSREFNAVLSCCNGLLMIELEDIDKQYSHSFEPVNYLIKHSLHSMVEAKELDAVYNTSVEEIRSLTGFDRVMLYKFDHEFNGEVVAESKKPELNSFLKQHFPESDIPKQARELYLRNPIRLLADVDAGVSPLYPQDSPVDLSNCILRSVSPIHCQYLKNMGVKASMSISIIIAGKLWGLVACHHYSRHVVPFESREIAQYMGLMLSYLIALKTQSSNALQEAKALSMNAAISDRMAKEVFFIEGLRQEVDLLMEMLNTTGVAWKLEEDIECFGDTPTAEQTAEVFDWMSNNKLTDDSIYYTHCLSEDNPAFASLSDVASGVLIMPLSITGNLFIMWFRKEMVQTKNWGGKPEKVIEFLDDGSHRLMPRSSFALWKENVRHKSETWKNAETSCALKFRNTVVNYVLAKSERLQKINDALEDMVLKRTNALETEISSRKKVQKELAVALQKSEESNRELERFAFVASHDLQEPLRKIQTFGDRIKRGSKSLGEDNNYYLSKMIDAANRMQELIKGVLSFSRINNKAGKISVFDGDKALQELLADLEILVADKHAKIEIEPIGQIYGDKPQIQRVLQNLILNSLKFSLPDASPRIHIYIESKTPEYLTLAVKDNGIGFDHAFAERIFNLFERLHPNKKYEGTGLGLAICKKIVDRHQGEIWAKSESGQGATFFIKLPRKAITKKNI